jgi:B-cell receptor-associated protein 31
MIENSATEQYRYKAPQNPQTPPKPRPDRNRIGAPNPPTPAAMIQLLFVVLAAEAAVAAALLFKTPLRKLGVLGIDRLKRGRRAPVAVKTVAGVIISLLASTLYSMAEISGRASGGDPDSGGGGGALTPTDQVLFSRQLLEASLMGRSR